MYINHHSICFSIDLLSFIILFTYCIIYFILMYPHNYINNEYWVILINSIYLL